MDREATDTLRHVQGLQVKHDAAAISRREDETAHPVCRQQYQDRLDGSHTRLMSKIRMLPAGRTRQDQINDG